MCVCVHIASASTPSPNTLKLNSGIFFAVKVIFRAASEYRDFMAVRISDRWVENEAIPCRILLMMRKSSMDLNLVTNNWYCHRFSAYFNIDYRLFRLLFFTRTHFLLTVFFCSFPLFLLFFTFVSILPSLLFSFNCFRVFFHFIFLRFVDVPLKPQVLFSVQWYSCWTSNHLHACHNSVACANTTDKQESSQSTERENIIEFFSRNSTVWLACFDTRFGDNMKCDEYTRWWKECGGKTRRMRKYRCCCLRQWARGATPRRNFNESDAYLR